MSFFAYEIVQAPAHLPVTVAATQHALAAAVVEEIERTILWRSCVQQQRRIVIDGPLPQILKIEPVTAIVSLTRWVAGDDYVVIPASTYNLVSSDPAGATIFPNPGMNWPAPARSIGSFAITYECGWTVTPESSPGSGDAVNEVPASIQLMVNRAIAFRAGSGLGDITIGSLKLSVADSYSTDRLPVAITSIGRAWAYRPGIIAARP